MKDTITIGSATTISSGYIVRGTIVYGGFDGVIVTATPMGPAVYTTDFDGWE